MATGVSTTDKWRPKTSMRRSFGHKRRGGPAQGALEGGVFDGGHLAVRGAGAATGIVRARKTLQIDVINKNR
jgi:hypothetical protein